MKKILSIISFFLLMASAWAQDVEDVLGVSKLKFQGTKYELGWSAHNSYQYLQEYFPKGQTPESFTEMFTISVMVLPPFTALQAAKAKEQELAERKEKQHDIMNWAVYENQETDESMIDFICYEGPEDAPSLIEFDIHRYRMVEVDNLPALQLIFYTRRSQGDNIIPFMHDTLPDLRKQCLEEITKLKVDCKVRR